MSITSRNHPTAQRTARQMLDASPWNEAPRSLLHDCHSIYGEYFQRRVKKMEIEEGKIALRSPYNQLIELDMAVGYQRGRMIRRERLGGLLSYQQREAA